MCECMLGGSPGSVCLGLTRETTVLGGSPGRQPCVSACLRVCECVLGAHQGEVMEEGLSEATHVSWFTEISPCIHMQTSVQTHTVKSKQQWLSASPGNTLI